MNMLKVKDINKINIDDYDVVVVGSGFAGSVIAEQLANVFDKKILVVEKRTHVGGNMYDKYDKYGFLIQQYGPHIFFTNDIGVLKYVSKFDKLVSHNCYMLSYVDKKYIQLPYNFKSIQQLIGYESSDIIINKIRKEYGCSGRISVFSLIENKDIDISKFGLMLFKKVYEPYICKQWGLLPDQISKDVIDRCKFSPNYVDRYLDVDYLYLPYHGFTFLIENMLTNPKIDVVVGTDANQFISFKNGKSFFKDCRKPIVYTGSLDELFGYKYGKLPYRSLKFLKRYQEKRKILPSDIVSMPQHKTIIRETEYKYFSPFICHQEDNISVTIKEIPYEYDFSVNSIRCYPVINDVNVKKYEKYYRESQKLQGLFLCGRLAEYKYYNMDKVIIHAIDMARIVNKTIITEDF